MRALGGVLLAALLLAVMFSGFVLWMAARTAIPQGTDLRLGWAGAMPAPST